MQKSNSYDPLQNHMRAAQAREDARSGLLETELCDMWLRMFPIDKDLCRDFIDRRERDR